MIRYETNFSILKRKLNMLLFTFSSKLWKHYSISRSTVCFSLLQNSFTLNRNQSQSTGSLRKDICKQ